MRRSEGSSRILDKARVRQRRLSDREAEEVGQPAAEVPIDGTALARELAELFVEMGIASDGCEDSKLWREFSAAEPPRKGPSLRSKKSITLRHSMLTSEATRWGWRVALARSALHDELRTPSAVFHLPFVRACRPAIDPRPPFSRADLHKFGQVLPAWARAFLDVRLVFTDPSWGNISPVRRF